MDGFVLLFSLCASVLTGVLFGLAPALAAARVDLNDLLKGAAKATDARSRRGLRELLVAAEVALAFVLVVGAGLLGKSFQRLLNVDPGFDTRNLLTMNLFIYGQRYREAPAVNEYVRGVIDRVRAAPGVESAAMVSTLPLGGSWDRAGFHIQDRRFASEAEAPYVDRYVITPDYLRVMRIPLQRGRAFAEADGPNAPPVALVSETLARQQWPNEDAIGKRIQLGGRDDRKPWAAIVGIVGDVRQYGLDSAPTMQAYIPKAQDPNAGMILVVRTSVAPARAESAVRQAIWTVDKSLPVHNVATMDQLLAASMAERRFTLTLLGLFGALALALAAVGIYGVISCSVTLRTREIGVRVALGADHGDVMRLVLGQGAAIVAAGLGAGLAASLALTRLLAGFLYEVEPTDPATAAAVACLLAAVALAAVYVPALRATRVDPQVALRHE